MYTYKAIFVEIYYFTSFQVYYDNNLVDYLGDDTEKLIKETMAHAQARYCRSGLGSRIHLKVSHSEQMLTKLLNIEFFF